MSIVLQNPAIEALAQQLATIQGITVEQLIINSLQAVAARTGLPTSHSLDTELTELRQWAKIHIQRDPKDTLDMSEMINRALGYNGRGEW